MKGEQQNMLKKVEYQLKKLESLILQLLAYSFIYCALSQSYVPHPQ